MKMRSVAALLKPILDIMRGAASKEPNPVRLRGMRESIEPLEGAATHPRAGCAVPRPLRELWDLAIVLFPLLDQLAAL